MSNRFDNFMEYIEPAMEIMMPVAEVISMLIMGWVVLMFSPIWVPVWVYRKLQKGDGKTGS